MSESPPLNTNENAHPAKVSGFEKLTRRLTSFQHKLHSVVCKRNLSFASNRTFATKLSKSNQNRLANLARQIGESQSLLARQIGESQCVPSETLRRVSYLLRYSVPSARSNAGWQSQGTDVPQKQKNNKVNFGTTDTPPSISSLGARSLGAPPPPLRGAAQGPSLGEKVGGR